MMLSGALARCCDSKAKPVCPLPTGFSVWPLTTMLPARPPPTLLVTYVAEAVSTGGFALAAIKFLCPLPSPILDWLL